MEFSRRQLLRLTFGSAALAAGWRYARAENYPSRPVRIIVPYAVGGGPDIVARLIGQRLADRLGQPFVIENRPGAGGNIGTEAVAHAQADGYTLLIIATTNALNTTFYDNLNFDFLRDIIPVAGVGHGPEVMSINQSVPAKTVPEFIAYAKANPGKLSMASTGTGSISHVAGELFKSMTGVNMIHVPYRGAQAATTDLVAGRVQVLFDALPGSIGHIKAGELRALAVTTATRSDVLPDVPSLGEFVPGYEASTWMGFGAPRNTPSEIVDKLNKEITAVLTDAKIRAAIADLGGTVQPLSPVEFGSLIADDTEKWAKVIRAANIKPE